ncbi:UDP-glucose 4-epimerase [Pseudomonas sp. 8AS]|uniref:UDP-glucose 4-epimerase family protein n=1 Tax=Pseudomonas sp. 8AS TaxID=2653163 RepID=UPI0012F005CC|nr:SDR family oxidoreductase [Pseudomonas sp. 8AS]VXB83771.1 UDP-glucose 4-epimerase [Pseudomonas sp. 8AS]
MFKVVVTGASGFVGQAVVKLLSAKPGMKVSAFSRQTKAVKAAIEFVQVGDFATSDFSHGLAGVDCVIHAAARVHVMSDSAANPILEYRSVNVHGTLSLARQAAAAGVKRFIFLSSIKVNGEQTQPGHPYTADSVPMPRDAYGISKHEAEQALLALAAETGMQVVIIRPVLVYGPGVKANFRSMMSWLAKGMPLPLGAIDNKRSLVALENLVDLIVTCIDHPAAANQTFLVSDDEDVSTSELLRRMARALGKPARLLPVPAWLLTVAATALGKRDVAQRLCGSLQVDISKTKALLNWVPVISLDTALQQTANDFLEQQD